MRVYECIIYAANANSPLAAHRAYRRMLAWQFSTACMYQYVHDLTGMDSERWQALVDRGNAIAEAEHPRVKNRRGKSSL